MNPYVVKEEISTIDLYKFRMRSQGGEQSFSLREQKEIVVPFQ